LYFGGRATATALTTTMYLVRKSKKKNQQHGVGSSCGEGTSEQLSQMSSHLVNHDFDKVDNRAPNRNRLRLKSIFNQNVSTTALGGGGSGSGGNSGHKTNDLSPAAIKAARKRSSYIRNLFNIQELNLMKAKAANRKRNLQLVKECQSVAQPVSFLFTPKVDTNEATTTASARSAGGGGPSSERTRKDKQKRINQKVSRFLPLWLTKSFFIFEYLIGNQENPGKILIF
jgi:hypothetical protein